MERILVVIIALISLTACKNDNAQKDVAEASIQEIKSADPNTIITESASFDTVNVAKMTFAEDRFDFGVVDEGEVVKHSYTFTNTGKAPLVITNAKSTCGCTVPVWPKEPVEVGESGTIQVSFNTKGKRSKQSKPVTITANTWPYQTVVYLSGEVVANPVEPSKPSN